MCTLQVRANSLAGYNLRGNGVIDRVNNVEQARSAAASAWCLRFCVTWEASSAAKVINTRM